MATDATADTTADEQVPATVTSGTADTNGLQVTVDGATVACPASALNGATYTAGQRVTVTIRNPRPPLVQGTDSDLT